MSLKLLWPGTGDKVSYWTAAKQLADSKPEQTDVSWNLFSFLPAYTSSSLTAHITDLRSLIPADSCAISVSRLFR